jgi:(p)ppGpp synthase/HD superfamily hydrolase
MNIVSEALVFATKYHKEQQRKDTKIPYMAHLLNVCKLLAENNCSDELLAAALLHDIVEDGEVTLQEVETTFGQHIADLVRGATELDKLENKDLDKKSSWLKRKEHTIHFLSQEATIEQLLVSGADKLDNLRSIVYDYSKIGDTIWTRFNASKEQQAWYYSSIANILVKNGTQNKILAEFGNEMLELCKKVF